MMRLSRLRALSCLSVRDFSAPARQNEIEELKSLPETDDAARNHPRQEEFASRVLATTWDAAAHERKLPCGCLVTRMTNDPSGFVVAVVDDDQSVLDSLGLLLESVQYQALLFGSGRALLQSGFLPDIDCLISDIDMPGMDGYELLRQVHAARVALPTILITGYPEKLTRLPPADRQTRFFSKPLQAPELLAAIRDCLGINVGSGSGRL